MVEELNNNNLNKINSNKVISNKEEQSTTELKKEQTNKSYRSSRSLKSNSHNHIPTTTQGNTTSGTRRTVLKSIRNLFVKASINLSIAAAKLKSFAEDALSSDEIVNELFLVTSSSSVDSSLLEQQEAAAAAAATAAEANKSATAGGLGGSEAAETDSRAGTSDMTVNSSNEANGGNETKPPLPTFQEFDAVQEAKKLQRESGSSDIFVDGHKIWQMRRDIWLNSTSEERTRAKHKSLENSLVGISKDNYPIIYNSLIEKQKTLKKPMKLKDALKIINAGWIASKKWERAAQGLA